MAEERKQDDQQEDLEQALQPEQREDLLGQMEENTNLTGSTTWETLGDDREEGTTSRTEPEADSGHERDRASRDKDRASREKKDKP